MHFSTALLPKKLGPNFPQLVILCITSPDPGSYKVFPFSVNAEGNGLHLSFSSHICRFRSFWKGRFGRRVHCPLLFSPPSIHFLFSWMFVHITCCFAQEHVATELILIQSIKLDSFYAFKNHAHLIQSQVTKPNARTSREIDCPSYPDNVINGFFHPPEL